jgi:hypothetical protein
MTMTYRILAILFLAASATAQTAEKQTVFRIKYVAEGVVYIEGGRTAGLSEKMKLVVRRNDESAAELEVVSVASTSAVCEIKNSTAPLRPGDMASLPAEDTQKSQILRAAGSGTHYAQTITFTDGDPLDEEAREQVPRPPSPEVNHIRARIGFEYNDIQDRSGSGITSSDMGIVMRTDMTRIGGSFWNLTGYTRFRFTTSNLPQTTTINGLLNRTYQMVLTYQNPQSNWTAGFGRYYLPWAYSLGTIDGGYLARRLSKRVTIGMFAGTTPDPTSWNFAPNREMAGAFVNIAAGGFEGLRYSSTEGIGLSRLSWRPEREFAFFENEFSWKRYFSVYDTLEVDRSHPTTQQPTANGTGIARSFFTFRIEPWSFLSFDLNHNYFRDFPTFDPRLVGTGLLDKLLFQGFSGGVRLQLPYHSTAYVTVGRSSGSNDPQASWNQMYGFAMSDILHTKIRGDFHYSRFNSSFGQGDYESASLSRSLWESFRFEAQAGNQNFTSPLTSMTHAHFINGNMDCSLGGHYFLATGVTLYRGQTQSYNQIYFTLGYRFGQ